MNTTKQSTLLLAAAVVAVWLVFPSPAGAGVWNSAGRWLGLGWSDGYHAPCDEHPRGWVYVDEFGRNGPCQHGHHGYDLDRCGGYGGSPWPMLPPAEDLYLPGPDVETDAGEVRRLPTPVYNETRQLPARGWESR